VRKTIFVLLAIVALVIALGPGASGNGVMHRAEVMPLRPEVVDQLRAEGRSSPELLFPSEVNKGHRFAAPEGTPLSTLSVPETLKALVILVEFSDTDHFYAQSLYEDLILDTAYDPPGNEVTPPGGSPVHGPTNRTLYNYYQEVSYGTVAITGTVASWVKVGHSYDYYCNATSPNWWGFGPYPQNVQGLVHDAVLKADEAGLDFSEFDTVDPYDQDEDGDYFEPDGWVDNLFIVHTGSGAEWTGQVDVIWSHSWDMSEDDFGYQIPEVIVDGVRIMDYSMEPEYGGIPDGPYGEVSDPFPPTVGVYAHEFGHVLGLPDEYDYGYESEGTGRWSLMAGGSWNMFPPISNRFLGNSPAHPSAWGKYRLGFVSPTVVPPEGLTGVSILPINDQPVAYRIDVPFSAGTEYFLAENRQQIGFDEGLGRMGSRAHGLLIYHIDENVLQAGEDGWVYWRPNEAECWRMNNANCTKVNSYNGQTHYGISLEQADGRFELEKGKNRGNAGDPFPGVGGNHTFSATSTPNSSSFYFWSGPSPVPGTSGVLITNIQEEAQTITADFGHDAQGRW